MKNHIKCNGYISKIHKGLIILDKGRIRSEKNIGMPFRTYRCQSVDKVYTLKQIERNAGRFRDFFLVGVVAYGREKTL